MAGQRAEALGADVTRLNGDVTRAEGERAAAKRVRGLGYWHGLCGGFIRTWQALKVQAPPHSLVLTHTPCIFSSCAPVLPALQKQHEARELAARAAQERRDLATRVTAEERAVSWLWT